VNVVQSADAERVALSMTPAEARRTQPYLTYQYAPLDRSDAARMLVSSIGQSGYVPQLVEKSHKRLDEIEIDAGEKIMVGNTGRKLGTVRDVVMDHGELVGIVMHPSGFFKEDVLLQVRFLGRGDDMVLFAHLTDSDLSQLKPFHPE
jgi:hypothetical protein